MKKRELNFEILRILGMLFIIGMHYLDKGGLMISSFDNGLSGYDIWVRLIEAFLVCGVNVYVLIGAYFLCEKAFSIKRVLKIWGVAIFYSILIGLIHMLVCRAIGLPFPLDKYGIFNLVFPVISEHYWFVSVYVVLTIVGPILNKSLKEMSKSSFAQLLLLMTLLLSVSITIIPMKLPIDGHGMNLPWFILLYMYGAYIRWYGIRILDSQGKSLILYIVSSFCIFLVFIFTERLYEVTHAFGDFITRQYYYNSMFCLMASLGLFCAFKNLKVERHRFEKYILAAASASFGVYLIHEHILLRYEWTKALGISSMYGSIESIIMLVPVILLVYIICGLIELVRKKIFNLFG